MPTLKNCYEFMMVDPPWPVKPSGKKQPRASFWGVADAMPYSTLTLEDIEQLLESNVFSMLSPDGVVWMWTVERYLHDTDAMMRRLGFDRHIHMIWDKGKGMAPAFTIQFSHEYLVWYYRPPMQPVHPEQRAKFTSVIYESSREHSRKPDEAYFRAQMLYPFARRLDVFSREPRPTWDQWGNQKDHFAKG